MTWQNVARFREDIRHWGRSDAAHGTPYTTGRQVALYTLRCEGLTRCDLRKLARVYDAAYRS
jgi:hypothetical protein